MNESAQSALALESIVSELSAAWNRGDAAAYAAPFAADAEQINIFGAQLCGRGEIEQRHDVIFKSIFQHSTNVFSVLGTRAVGPDALIARVASAVDVPRGPLQGRLETIVSMVLQHSARWEIVLFHNTRVAGTLPESSTSVPFRA